MKVLRSSLDLPWADFVAHWCLGIEPEHSEAEAREALLAVERHWPERLDRMESHGRGLMYIHPAIHLGLILLCCESLDGFREVLARAKKGEASARSELEFAAGLVRIGLIPSLEPQLGAKKLDTRFVFDEQEVFCEVIAPERSDAMEDAEAQMTAMAPRLVQDNPDTEIEVLLSPSFDFAKSKDLEDYIRLTDVGLKRHEA